MTWTDVTGTAYLFAYYLVVCALIPGLLRVYAGAPREGVRKLQHLGYSLSIFLLLRLFSTWYAAVLGAGLLLLVGYPVLAVVEKTAFYRRVLVDRRPRGGELRMQLVLVQLSFGLLIFIFWGLLGTRWQYLIAAAVMAWGLGDAAAALIGKTLGKRVILSRFVDGSKTVAGTLAMGAAAFVGIFLTLWGYAGQSWQASLVTALVVAPCCAAVELVSRRGIDTLTVPLATASLMLPLMHLASFLGW